MRFFLKYLVSTDHKVIGLLYAGTSLFFLLVGFGVVMLVSFFVPGGAANNGWTS